MPYFVYEEGTGRYRWKGRGAATGQSVEAGLVIFEPVSDVMNGAEVVLEALALELTSLVPERAGEILAAETVPDLFPAAFGEGDS